MLTPRVEVALQFAITSGIRKQVSSERSFVRALRAYVRMYDLTHPEAHRNGRIPLRKLVTIARTLHGASSRRAADFQSEFLRKSFIGDYAHAERRAS